MRHSLQLLVATGLLLFIARAFAQGPLEPPLPPGPTMKSLDQIEARYPISGLPYSINAPGSYYLTRNLQTDSGDALTINSDGVTLDLNGFSISSYSSPPSGAGIRIMAGHINIRIFNGSVIGAVTNNNGTYSGSGFLDGITISDTTQNPNNITVSEVFVSGCQNNGIYVGTNAGVHSCRVSTVGHNGIVGNDVTQSEAIDCGHIGIYAGTARECDGESATYIGLIAVTATNCYGFSSTGPVALSADTAVNCYGLSDGSAAGVSGNVAQNCTGVSSSGIGLGVVSGFNCFAASGSNGTAISLSSGGTLVGCSARSASVGITAGQGSTLQNCTATHNTANGIVVSDGSAVINCTSQANGGVGVQLSIGSSATDCNVRNNGGDGINAPNDCYIARNHVSANGAAAPSAGIHTTSAGNRIEENSVIFNSDTGIKVDGFSNLIIKNTARFHGTKNFVIADSNLYGTIVNLTVNMSPPVNGTNSAAATTGSNDPQANFAY